MTKVRSRATTVWTLTLLTAVGAGLGACSGLPSLTTGSLAANPAASEPEQKVATPVDRALHVAATSARAQKCGYFFDPAKLRDSYLANETQRGATPEVLAQVAQSYDFTQTRVAASIKNSATFCSQSQTAEIRGSLQRALAGDFEPAPKAKEVADVGWFGNFEASQGREDFNRDHIYDPLLNPDRTKRVEEE